MGGIRQFLILAGARAGGRSTGRPTGFGEAWGRYGAMGRHGERVLGGHPEAGAIALEKPSTGPRQQRNFFWENIRGACYMTNLGGIREVGGGPWAGRPAPQELFSAAPQETYSPDIPDSGL